MSKDPASAAHALRQLRKDMIIAGLALISVAIGVNDLARPRADARFTVLDAVDLAIVTIFIFEFVHGARSSGDWRGYLRRHWFELPSLLPVTGNMVKGAETAPLLRGLRLVRLVRAARLLRIIGAATRLKAIWGKALRVARRAHLFGLALFASFIVLAGAGLAWLVEGSISPHFRGGDALWWSLNMFSNVAYVDFQPEKAAGRLIAALLQFCGIACIGLFTASLASALVTDPGAEPERPEDEPLD